MTYAQLRLVDGGVTEERPEFTSVASLHASRQRLIDWLRALQPDESEPVPVESGLRQIPEAA